MIEMKGLPYEDLGGLTILTPSGCPCFYLRGHPSRDPRRHPRACSGLGSARL